MLRDEYHCSMSFHYFTLEQYIIIMDVESCQILHGLGFCNVKSVVKTNSCDYGVYGYHGDELQILTCCKGSLKRCFANYHSMLFTCQ